jgi:hypothetical protein
VIVKRIVNFVFVSIDSKGLRKKGPGRPVCGTGLGLTPVSQQTIENERVI